jgi:L,D-peptidoglycan transpeptidase YkuD (ErfK/YbiS/YcfS/YnhG family)
MMRRLCTALAVCTAAVALLLAPGSGWAAPQSGQPGPSGPRSLAAAVGEPAAVRQLVTISSRHFSSTTGTLDAWSRTKSGRWVLSHGPVPVVIGYGGWVIAAHRRQSTGTTPAGRFRIPAAFGRLPDPGARLPYQHVDSNDWWPYEPRDPATYNIYQTHKAAQTHWRPTYAEHLDTFTTQYEYAIEVGFNLPGGVHYSHARRQLVASREADTRAGGGIFLHVRGDGLTAGCVAMSRSDMRWLLTWIRPRTHPRLVMGPHHYIVTL